ncbi:MAG TPA: acyl-CoA dehydrogenase family protein [Polyangiaceae bacterium]|nr:acyl-CoA dehydrogenase family protein [Polyangiaceae bacterium]
MKLTLTEDQARIAQTAGAFFAERSSVTRLRRLRDGGDALGYSRSLWKEMAGLGWTGIPFAERDGGAGLGLSEAVLVAEAIGRSLAPEPFVACVMLAGTALSLGGSEEHRSGALRALVSGDAVVALAFQEPGPRFDLHRVTARAEQTAGGYRLTGTKAHVMGGSGADAFVVAARTAGDATDAGGVTLFFVPAGAAGLEVLRQHRLDSRSCAIVRMSGVEVPESAIVGVRDRGAELLGEVVDRACVALCGEMLGGMTEAFERTVAYMKQRVQFGAPIGSFQALKHRAARLLIDIELARSAVWAAARAVDGDDERRSTLVSAAKARCSDGYLRVASEAVQLHGGIGMTDEHDIGLFLKHARVCEMTFGDAAHHRDRFARLCGY